ncbi:MAG: phenylalanine--tRNA ligase subunit alpha [bacterium]|nr:phenylalanine--tRNA ligase subunit alpha [bacterium]
MNEQTLALLEKEIIERIQQAGDLDALEKVRIEYMGRKGKISQLLRSLKDISLEDRRVIAPHAQALQKKIEAVFDEKSGALGRIGVSHDGIDVTMPGKKIEMGHLHPLTLVEKEIREIFKRMNFSVVEGPEVESEQYNFDALNIPKDHPARDMWDTFWLRSNQNELKAERGNEKGDENSMSHVANRLLLRTHTSPVQIRYMETHKPPFQIIVPGRVFRYEATDASHEINFYQVEGLMVGKDITLANFKFIIQEFFKRLFKKNVTIRLRPSYFPFVEPGLEVDIACVKCSGKGCNLCKDSGWLEVMGAGMVHPNVFRSAHYNPRDIQGFAFGLGLERIAMIKYNIPDIRLFYSGDVRFISQF